MSISRRGFLGAAARTALALPFSAGLARLLDQRAYAALPGKAERVIFFYFPDGVVGPSQNGEPSQWHVTGSELDFTLPPQLEHLQPWKDQCVFFRGLTMGPTDSGSHPGGAQKLLTAVDHGQGQSIDQHLAKTVGSDKPHHLLYVGAQANHNNASGDKHISYAAAGSSVAPDDSPLSVFERLFDGSVTSGGGGAGEAAAAKKRQRTLSLLDAAQQDLAALSAKLGKADASKLEIHLGALEEVEARVKALAVPPPTPPSDDCKDPTLDAQGVGGALYAPENFPTILRLQTDLVVQGMACGLSRVGVIQGSHHTSELIMSRFPGTEMYDPSYDMRSHQASHYGAAHDDSKLEFSAFRKQRRWWVEQFAYLLEQLAARPEGEGTMLDYTLCVLCTEVCDGNTHSHDDMPFVLAGQAGGAIKTGRFLDYGYGGGSERHSRLLTSIANAMGSDIGCFGQACSGPLPGLVS